MSVGSYTKIGAGLWHWDKWLALDDPGRMFWLALYTSPQAKRIIPGLWHGSIQSMAESARMPFDVGAKCLDTLLDREMVEFDQKQRVLRLTELPDAGEWPANGSILRSWWGRFRSLPECAVRDAHVSVLWWMIERGSLESERNRSGEISQNHLEIWAETFGRVKIPAPRRRGIRRLVDSDTGTDSQPSLFDTGLTDPPSLVAPLPPRTLATDLEDLSTVSTPSGAKSRDHHAAPSGEGEGVGVGEGSGSGSVSAPDPEITTRAKPALALVPSIDDHRARVGEIARTIGMQHVMAFARAKAELRSTAWGPGATDKHEELVALLNSMVSLDDAQTKCEYALAIREAEAITINSLKYFSGGMWKPENFRMAIAREIAEVNGQRAKPVAVGARNNVFDVADTAIDAFFDGDKK